MPRLLRPAIPLSVKCRVALRQLGEMWPDEVIKANKGRYGAFLDDLLGRLAGLLACDASALHLDHNPALGAREKMFRKGKHVDYRPAANDPEYLIYREKHAHHIKTNVRGDGAQFPDRVLIKRNRRLENPKPPVDFLKKTPRTKFKGKSKRRWGSRPFPAGRGFR